MPRDRMISPDGKLSVRSFFTPEEYQAHREPARPQRIHIIGTGGTGKTTFSRIIAGRFKIPSYDLDAIGYEGAFEGRPGNRRPLEDRLRDVSKIASQPLWITEGIFLWWIDELLDRADALPDFVWSGRTDYRRAKPLVPRAPDDDSALSRAGTFAGRKR